MKNLRSTHSRLLAPFLGSIVALVASTGHASPFPNFPLQTGTGSIPPNILFIMDDSGSMGSTYMGAAGDYIRQNLTDGPAERSYVNNFLYYNPEIDYEPWMGWDGNRMTGGTTYGAAFAHFDLAEGPINLGDSDSCYSSHSNSSNTEVCGGDQTFWVPKDGRSDPGTSFGNYYRFRIRANDLRIERCDGADLGACNYVLPTDRRSEEEERNNFATWFSYHRTRMKAAKAGATEAFGQLGEHYRVGYDSIWRLRKGLRSESGGNGPVFPIPVGTNQGRFSDDNREDWFDWVINARNYSTTPLRNTLKRAGDYYEGEFNSHSVPNPWGPGSVEEQLSCRQSYAILTTDGYWNGGSPGVGNVDNEEGERIELPDGSERDTYSPALPFRDDHRNTLADVAMHYWKRDLQPDLVNNVPGSSRNPAVWQHMSTFGISIGLGGSVDQTSVAEVMAQEGVTIGGNSVSWPDPSGTGPESIDDLLHAAVNGRGEFVAASNPQEFADALRSSLAVIASRQAAGANVASNGPSLSSTSMLFQATYTSGDWTGDVAAVRISGGLINPDPDDDNGRVWSMAEVASEDRGAFARRNVWTISSGGSGTDFPTSGQEAALARGTAGAPGYVSGEDNAKYIRGSGANEGLGRDQLRRRASPIGTIINSSPFYLSENETLFVGANDGMLHAVNAEDGSVRFSYVPAGLNFQELARLSSQDYQHSFFVDGGIDVTTRALSGNVDRNILVASLGRGGKGLFGLDVTNPNADSASQVVRWDETFQGNGIGEVQRNTGYILGAPLVRRGNNGRLLAIYGNGYYSATGSATLFIRNAETGGLIRQITVDTSGGNGLGEVRAADLDGNGTADVIYAGDLKGNIWKFDISSTNNVNQWGAATVSGNTARPLFRATDPSGNPQPVTSAVALARDPSATGGGRIFVVFGTGSYMIPGDLESTQVQTLYAVIDDSGKDKVRNLDRDDLAHREIMQAGVDEYGRPARAWESFSELENENGWYVDLDTPTAGERVVTAPVVRGRALWFASIIPRFGGGCEVGGTGYLNAVDVFTGTNPGRPDGSTYSFIDVNDDGDGADYLDGGAGDEGLVTSVDIGIGMPSQPTFVDDDAYAAGSDAELGRLPGLPVGKQPARLRWHELVGEE